MGNDGKPNANDGSGMFKEIPMFGMLNDGSDGIGNDGSPKARLGNGIFREIPMFGIVRLGIDGNGKPGSPNSNDGIANTQRLMPRQTPLLTPLQWDQVHHRQRQALAAAEEAEAHRPGRQVERYQ